MHAPARLDFYLRFGTWLPGERFAPGQDAAMQGKRVLASADLRCQLGQLELRREQRPSRGCVVAALEDAAQLVVEAAGRVQKLVAERPELRLLEEEVLADAGVEGLDRIHR